MTNNKQQTVVDSIIEFMKENQYFIGNDLYEFMKQAKKMEKEQIINANWEASEDTDRAEQYYNLTFKNTEQ